jgi:hypothetical protein
MTALCMCTTVLISLPGLSLDSSLQVSRIAHQAEFRTPFSRDGPRRVRSARTSHRPDLRGPSREKVLRTHLTKVDPDVQRLMCGSKHSHQPISRVGPCQTRLRTGSIRTGSIVTASLAVRGHGTGVSRQFASTVKEEESLPILVAAVRGSSHAATFWRHVTKDRNAAVANGISEV